ncbi:M16 family metallopeptidase [Vibrio taketomensis]|uniref:M16 family metallopeptidase n=1 Tax=Vibrio taketomensis TaxID=2572923 RepID=UPI00138A2318|nr:M16 family metallopeptidase [Vibrio taketomensis]
MLGCQTAKENDVFQEPNTYIRGQLANGMKYILIENEQPEKRISLQLVVHAGSLNEQDHQKGIAHLVEHMAFNGTEEFPANTLIEHQEALGLSFGRDVNAMTEYYTTSYLMHLPSNQQSMLDEGLYMLSQQVSALTFDQFELEKERPVVEEEWRSGLTLMSRLSRENRKILTQGSLLAERSPIGHMDIVQNAEAQQVKSFWQDWYHPNNMTLIAVGSLNQKQLEQSLQSHFGLLKPQSLPIVPEVTLPINKQLEVAIIDDPEISTEVLSLNFRFPMAVVTNSQQLRDQLVNELLITMLNNRLRELYVIGSDNISKMAAMSQPLATHYRNNRVMAILSSEDYSSAIKEMFTHVSSFTEYGFIQNDIDTARTQLIANQYTIADSLTDTTNRRLLMSTFNRIRTHQPLVDQQYYAHKVEEISQEITLQEINRCLRQMVSEGNPIVIAQVSENNRAKFPSTLNVTAHWDKAMKNPLPLKISLDVPNELMKNKPKPAEIIANERFGDVHHWTLSNGTQVWFEFSDQNKNQLNVRYQGWGGSQHLSESLRKASYQLRQMSTFGYGGLSSEQLSVLNAAYPNRMMNFVGQDTHGMFGSADSQSFENLLQNLYLQITEPQVNDEIWRSNKALLQRGIDSREKSPTGKFNVAIDRVRYKDNLSMQPLTRQELENMDTQTLMQAWDSLYGNANGHHLIVVGDTNPEKVIRLAQRYVGNLPSESRRFEPLILPGFISGIHDITVENGGEPIGLSRDLFSVDSEITQDKQYLAQLSSRVMSVRLREGMREDVGGVYSVRFGIRADRAYQQIHGLISYGHDPQRAVELRQKAKQIIADTLNEGVTQEELQNVVKQIQHTLTPNAISNRQKMKWLSDRVFYGDELNQAEIYSKWLSNVTVEDVDKFLEEVLTAQNWIHATLTPEISKY